MSGSIANIERCTALLPRHHVLRTEPYFRSLFIGDINKSSPSVTHFVGWHIFRPMSLASLVILELLRNDILWAL